MKKTLLMLLCASFLVGFGDTGYAFLFLGGGGGGKRPHVDMGTVGKSDYKVFQNQDATIRNQNSGLTDEKLRHYLDGLEKGG